MRGLDRSLIGFFFFPIPAGKRKMMAGLLPENADRPLKLLFQKFSENDSHELHGIFRSDRICPFRKQLVCADRFPECAAL